MKKLFIFFQSDIGESDSDSDGSGPDQMEKAKDGTALGTCTDHNYHAYRTRKTS